MKIRGTRCARKLIDPRKFASHFSRTKTNSNMTKPPFVTISIIGLIAMSLINAGAADLQGTAESTIVRHEQDVKTAQAAVAQGDKAFKEKNYDLAVVEYSVRL